MSANRSVQAAQRRRAGPPEPAAPGRGPQPSINSSQMFAAGQQQRMGPGSGQVSGRLAGQNAALAQKQMMEQQQSQQSQQSGSGSALSGINKMTIPQAITLITLRLGKVETQLQNVALGSGSGSGISDEDGDNIFVDKNVILSLIGRIDALEKRPTGSAMAMPSGSTIVQDVSLLKQQFETIKPIVVQSKNTTSVLKQQIDGLKIELTETKELITVLQNLTMDNSNKIMAMNSVFNADNDNDNDNDAFLNESQEYDANDLLGHNQNFSNDGNEIVGTNLKELIESEFNSEA
jgi:hypothetical protein